MTQIKGKFSDFLIYTVSKNFIFPHSPKKIQQFYKVNLNNRNTFLLNLLWLVPDGHLWQFHHMSFRHNVLQHVHSRVKLLLAAIATTLVDLPTNEVHQLDLLVESKV